MKADILEYLDEHGVRYELESDIDRVIGEVDVVYQTRIRPERVRDVNSPQEVCHRLLRRAAHEAGRADPASACRAPSNSTNLWMAIRERMYFRQARNGLYVRMALLTMLLDKSNLRSEHAFQMSCD